MNRSVYVAGHNGMVGSAIVRQLRSSPATTIVTVPHGELDLRNQRAVAGFFSDNSIDEIYFCAARVGGIHANDTYPADFIYDNLMMECNVIHQAFMSGVNKLLFLGSSCIYPRLAAQPTTEKDLLTGSLEPTNEPYALAKIAGIKLCESYNRQHGTDYRSVMPTNLYGPKDNFHHENSHVIPALLRRFHEAVQGGTDSIAIWGTGTQKREFLHVDDMASASVCVMNLSREEYMRVTEPRVSHINVGSGEDCTIAELANTIADVTGYCGSIRYDTGKPDGAPRKLMDSCKLHALGWRPQHDLRSGLQSTYDWYVENVASVRQ